MCAESFWLRLCRVRKGTPWTSSWRRPWGCQPVSANGEAPVDHHGTIPSLNELNEDEIEAASKQLLNLTA